MYTVSLIARPDGLDRTLVRGLSDAWSGSAVHWLSPEEAAEFTVGAAPENLWQIWEEAQAEGVDLVLQQTQDRRKSMLLADMDSTMIGQECIDELADEAGVGDHVKDSTARAMNGELDFSRAWPRASFSKCMKSGSPSPPAARPRLQPWRPMAVTRRWSLAGSRPSQCVSRQRLASMSIAPIRCWKRMAL